MESMHCSVQKNPPFALGSSASIVTKDGNWLDHGRMSVCLAQNGDCMGTWVTSSVPFKATWEEGSVEFKLPLRAEPSSSACSSQRSGVGRCASDEVVRPARLPGLPD